jgi:hypothetical protein
MKKLIITFVIVVSVLLNATGQFTKAGGGLALSSGFPFHERTWEGNKSGVVAISVKGIYEINVNLHLSPSVTVFYPHITKDISETQIISTIMFDLNAHYVFNSLHRFEFYGLGGIDYLLAKNKYSFDVSPSTKERDNVPGINLGLGTYMKLNEKFDLSVEAKYIFSKYHQFMVNGGILLNLDWMKKNEKAEI